MAAQHERVVELLQIQSSQLERAENEDRAAQQRHEQLMQEIRRIIEKLGDRMN